jgi:hypothetical protein
MFSTANRTSVSSPSAGCRDEVAGVLALPAERRVHDDGLRAERSAALRRADQLRPRVGAPHPLRDEQARRVDREDRDAVVVGQPAQRLASWLTGSVQTMTSTPS